MSHGSVGLIEGPAQRWIAQSTPGDTFLLILPLQGLISAGGPQHTSACASRHARLVRDGWDAPW